MTRKNKPKPDPAMDGPKPPRKPPKVALDLVPPDDEDRNHGQKPKRSSKEVPSDTPWGTGERDIVFEATSKSVQIKILTAYAGWKHAKRFKQAVDSYMSEGIDDFSIDCKACKHMDSTFMGCIAMLSLALLKASGAKPHLLNVNQHVRGELEELGLLKLFNDPKHRPASEGSK